MTNWNNRINTRPNTIFIVRAEVDDIDVLGADRISGAHRDKAQAIEQFVALCRAANDGDDRNFAPRFEVALNIIEDSDWTGDIVRVKTGGVEVSIEAFELPEVK